VKIVFLSFDEVNATELFEFKYKKLFIKTKKITSTINEIYLFI